VPYVPAAQGEHVETVIPEPVL
jgi:hypothetical protein